MRRSHMYSITICRCGSDVVDAMMDDFTLRTLLPVRMFAGLSGIKQSQRPGHLRRSSSMMSNIELDIGDLLDDYDKSACYARIFNREGAIDGNCLCLDTPFLDAIRSYIEHGGLARNCITPNIVKWRRMVKYAASGDDPYLLMSDIRIVNGQWSDCIKALPNSKFKKYSFSVIFYDGSTKQDSPKISHKIIKQIKPKDDIIETFKRRLYMNGAYICIALSRRSVSDDSLPTLFDNVENFVKNASNKYGYIARRVALGVHINKQIYVDFQVFVKSTRAPRKRRAFSKNKKSKNRKSIDNGHYNYDEKYDDYQDDDDDDDDEEEEDLSELSDDDDDEEDESDLNQQSSSEQDEDEDPSFYKNTHK